MTNSHHDCHEMSWSGDGHGRWACDVCGKDQGPQESALEYHPPSLATVERLVDERDAANWESRTLLADVSRLTADLTEARAQVGRLRAVADAAVLVTNEWYARGDGGCEVWLQMGLRESLAALHSVDEGEGT